MDISCSELNEKGDGGLIVGIGASAGGLNAFRAFFSTMPVHSGMSFVLVQHLSPDHKSLLTEILGKATAIPVVEAEETGRTAMAPATTPWNIWRRSVHHRAKTGHDFSRYKEKTVTRRIQRRMQVLQADTVPDYLARLRDDPKEVELLFRDLLIGVTQFFRDPDAFDALRNSVLPKLIEGKGIDDPIRIWVPGCSTGEEVYSIGILLREAMEQHGIDRKVQIFGTDIDDLAVTFARAGHYKKTVGLSSDRLERWFAEEKDEFIAIRQIREMCVFSDHNVIRDPPFSKLDLISCRNLLIYMDTDLQNRVLRTFHYALNQDGTLFLGSSEGVGRRGKLFATLDRSHRIFRRRDADGVLPGFSPAPTALHPPAHLIGAAAMPSGIDRIDRSARRALAKYSPVYLVIDRHQNIVRFSGGEAGRYLEPSAGAASLNLFGNLRRSLRSIVCTAVQTALDTREPVIHGDIVIEIEGKTEALTVIVEPISAGKSARRSQIGRAHV